jgi:DNA-binding response OmpR family regulator
VQSGTPTDKSHPGQPEVPFPQTHGDIPRVLIVDDNEPTARALAALLATAHHKSAVFHRGHEALEYARHNPCLAAVVDIHLPDISGILLAQQLRTLSGADMPVVLLSGDTSMPTLSAVSEIGATHFFSKPVNASHLLERLCHWIGEGGR